MQSELIWLNRPQSHFDTEHGWKCFQRYVGTRAGTVLDSDGLYRCVTVSYKGIRYTMLEHVIIWAIYNGRYPDGTVDHSDGDGLNNDPSNLTETSHSGNMHNKSMYKNNKSGHVGVTWYKRYEKWLASGRHEGKSKTIGYFDNLQDAIDARKEWEIGKGFSDRHGK